MKKQKRKPRKAPRSDKRKAAKVSRQTEFLGTVLESLTHPFYVIDAETYAIKMANSAARLGRLTEKTTCHALTHKRKKPCGSEAHPCPLDIVKKTKKPVTVEHVHHDRDGNSKSMEVHGFPVFDTDGNVVQMIECCMDVTDRKKTEEALQESERRYRSFVQNFQGIVYQGRLDFVPVFFHGAVEQITGYREDEFTSGKPRWDQIIYPEDVSAIYETVRRLSTNPGFASEREYRIVHKNGQIRWVHELIQNVCDDSGKPAFVQGALYDVTERRRMEDDLRKYRERLEELVQARTTELTQTNKQLRGEIARREDLERELLSVVEQERQRIGQELHDSIGQQLTGIAFMMEVLVKKLADQSLSQEIPYAEKINARVGRAVEMARDLAKGLHPIDLDKKGLAAALQELAADTEQLFDVSCTFTSDETVPAGCIPAPINLYRIAQEAITNAIRHGKAENISLRLSSQNGSVVLSVENDGVGFPAVPGRTEGMGLKIMRYRAELMNSSLTVCKGARGGTIVTCVLPKQENS